MDPIEKLLQEIDALGPAIRAAVIRQATERLMATLLPERLPWGNYKTSHDQRLGAAFATVLPTLHSIERRLELDARIARAARGGGGPADE